MAISFEPGQKKEPKCFVQPKSVRMNLPAVKPSREVRAHHVSLAEGGHPFRIGDRANAVDDETARQHDQRDPDRD